MSKIKKKVLSILLVLSLSAGMTGIINADQVYAGSKKIHLRKISVSLTAGKTYQQKLFNKSGKVIKASRVKWKSSKPSVAKINKKGKITAVKKGTAKMTAKYKGRTYKFTVKVTGPKKSPHFSAIASDMDRMMKQAVAQYRSEKYTRLSEPVRYDILWLGYTHVTYGSLDFQMTDFDRKYLKAVALNFEKSVEKITNHNLDIRIDLYFVNKSTPLTKDGDEEWLYLAQDTVQKTIDRYAAKKNYDTVLTAVQTAGKENDARNKSKKGYGVNYVILGLETAGLEAPIGYSTFDLGEPNEGTYPLKDPEIPSLYATAVAVHEWMHQLEYMGTLLGIEYPDTHAYIGPSEFPGYKKYTADKNDYDFFEFYKLVLKGKLPYRAKGMTKRVGMYPKMWKLAKHSALVAGNFTIKAANGRGYLTGRSKDPVLTVTGDPCIWNISYAGDGRFVLSPKKLPGQRIDLSNAWDEEGNTLGLSYDTGYIDAQSWYLVENSDGTYFIQTPYESGRVITVAGKGKTAKLCSIGAGGMQKWSIMPAD